MLQKISLDMTNKHLSCARKMHFLLHMLLSVSNQTAVDTLNDCLDISTYQLVADLPRAWM
jgi:hypothetical protein